MNIMPLLGLLAFAYSGLVIYITLQKPTKIWEMSKIKMFRKVLGEKGTVIFFYIWSVAFLGLGIWAFVAK